MFTEYVNSYAARRLRLTGRPAAPSTLLTKESHLRTVARTISAEDPSHVGTTLGDRAEVVNLLDRLYAQLSPGSVRNIATTLREYGEYTVAQGWIEASALDKADTPGGNPRKVVTVYSRDEMETLVSGARGVDRRLWAFIAFLADTGRRVGEALSLEWVWFRLDVDPAHVVLPKTKSGRQNLVPLSERLCSQVFTSQNIAALQAERGRWGKDPEAFCFPFRYSSVEVRMRRLCDNLGMEWRGFHCFRHSRATELLAGGAPIQAVSRLLGHEAVTTTARVYDWTDALSFAEWAQ